MDKSTATDYVCAKSQGMLAKSFVGPKKSNLFSIKNLSDLWRTLFGTSAPLVPENMLARAIEEEAERKFINDYIKLLSAFDKPDAIAVHLLRFYDYQNVKELNSALLMGQKEMPVIANIGSYSQLHYSQWPKLPLITQNSDISWLSGISSREEQKSVDAKLDIQYTRALWASVKEIPAKQRSSVEKLIKEQIVLQNILWAIRLKTYYNFNYDEIFKELVFASDEQNANDILASPALAIISKPVDSWDAWKDWSYAHLLNPHEEGSIWIIDPTWLQSSINIYLNKQAYKSFNKSSTSAHILVTWYKIKEYELNCIRTFVEGLRLNVESEQIKQFVW